MIVFQSGKRLYVAFKVKLYLYCNFILSYCDCFDKHTMSRANFHILHYFAQITNICFCLKFITIKIYVKTLLYCHNSTN